MKKVILTLSFMFGAFALSQAQSPCGENETYIVWDCGDGCAWVTEYTSSGYLDIDAAAFFATKRELTMAEQRYLQDGLSSQCLGGNSNESITPN